MSSAQPSLSDQTQPFAVVPSPPAASAQALWFALQSSEWASLAILPAGPGESALETANALYDVGALASGGPMRLLDARTVTLASSSSFIVNMTSLVSTSAERRTSGGIQRALVVLAPVLDEPAGIPIALTADAVVLTVNLGSTTLDAARETLELIGASRVLGCILLSG